RSSTARASPRRCRRSLTVRPPPASTVSTSSTPHAVSAEWRRGKATKRSRKSPGAHVESHYRQRAPAARIKRFAAHREVLFVCCRNARRAGRVPWRAALQRRDFLALTGLTAGGLMVPSIFGKAIAAEQLLTTLDPALKKRLADDALNAARAAGATYCDVRIGRYLRQFVITREDKVQNVVNTESTGTGIRVIVNGAWGFAATNDLS